MVLDDIKTAKPTADFDAQRSGGFIKPDQIVEAAFNSLPPVPEKGKGSKKAKK